MTLTTKIRAAIKAELVGAQDFANPKFNLPFFDDLSLANGTGVRQADLIFSDQRTLGASGNEELDLSGTLLDPLGQAVVFAKVKGILVRAATGNTNNVLIGGAAANGFSGLFSDATDEIVVKPGGTFLWADPINGVAVTAGTGDLLRIENSGAGTGVTYDLIIIGTSA